MGGAFRIARAELIKIFKKPSIYIMGVLLALVIALLMFTFSPHDTYNYSVDLKGSNIEEIYESFENDSLPDSKSILNNTFNNAKRSINDYYNYNNRLKNINEHTTLLIDEQNELSELISTNKSHQAIKNQFEQVENSLDWLMDYFTSHDNLKELSFYVKYLDSTEYSFYFNNTDENKGLLNRLKQATNDVNKENLSDLEGYANDFRNNYLENFRNNYLENFSNIDNDPISTMFGHYNELILKHVKEYKGLVTATESNQRKDLELENLRDSVDSYLEYINLLTKDLSGNNNFVMVTESDAKNAEEFLKSVLYSVDNMEGIDQTEKHKNLYNNFVKNFDFDKGLDAIKNNFKPILFNNASDLKDLENIKAFLDDRITPVRQEVLKEIGDYADANPSKDSAQIKEEFLNIIRKYKVISINTEAYVKNKLTLKISNIVGATSVNNYVGFSEFNKYRINEETVKIEYQFDNNVFASDYTTTFAFNQNSGESTTFYDFMYYALKISSIFIIVFAIIMAANIMAFEFDTGTIKLLAIRPFKRWKILFGKLLSVMFFVGIFVLFSAVISFIAGIASFPTLSIAPAMIVFNASKVFIVNPAVLMLLFILSIILEILFYATIALALSTIFKSFSAALSSSILVLLVGYLLNAMLVGTFWFAFVPFLNTDMFRFLGGSFIGADHTSLLAMFINSRLLSASNFYVSIGVYGITLALFLSLSYLVFRKRDI